jgi:hypothetical protein
MHKFETKSRTKVAGNLPLPLAVHRAAAGDEGVFATRAQSAIKWGKFDQGACHETRSFVRHRTIARRRHCHRVQLLVQHG